MGWAEAFDLEAALRDAEPGHIVSSVTIHLREAVRSTAREVLLRAVSAPCDEDGEGLAEPHGSRAESRLSVSAPQAGPAEPATSAPALSAAGQYDVGGTTGFTATDQRVLALLRAVCEGDEVGVRRLLAGGVSPDAVSDQGHTALGLAVVRNDLRLVASVLQQGASPLADHFGWGNPFRLAAALGRDAVVEAYLQSGYDPNSEQLGFPFHVAVDYGQEETVRLMLMRGARADLPDGGGMTPLHHAAAANHPGVIRLLCKYAKGDGNADGPVCGWLTPVHAAAIGDAPEAIGCLGDLGWDLNAPAPLFL